MTGPSAAAADATNIDDGAKADDLADRSHRTNAGKSLDPRVFIARETVCPLACSAKPGHCAWNCAPLSLRENEIAA
ncbi:hypothetical protein [Ilumatobacter sp.]|uniref:hypothetical protein n=1 Tax=Ilumatobacter sp. TaxID=1967498 RepID=UPI003751E0D2